MGKRRASIVYFGVNVDKLASFHGGVIVAIAKFAKLGGHFDDDPPGDRLCVGVEASLAVDCDKKGQERDKYLHLLNKILHRLILILPRFKFDIVSYHKDNMTIKRFHSV